MPRRSASYEGVLDEHLLARALAAFRRASEAPVRFEHGWLSRGAVRWELDSEAEFLQLLTTDVDEASLALGATVGGLELQVTRRSPRSHLAVRLPSVDAVESVFADLEPVAGPARSPVVFIGHGRSPVWRELADHLRDHHGVQVLTYESAVRAGVPNHTVLKELAERTRLALLVHTVEDVDERGVGRTGENVVHETGLFQALLGVERAVVLREDGCRSFANVDGLNELRFSSGRIVEVFGEVVAVLRRELRDYG